MRSGAALCALIVLPLVAGGCGSRTGLLALGEGEEVRGIEAPAAPIADAGGPPPPTERPATAIPPDPLQARADKIDILFVIDDSGSMRDKQAILADTLPDLVSRLINPACVEAGTLEPVADQPADGLEPCPEGALREFNAVQDVHIGVVSTSLGSAGTASCASGAGDARGRLLSRSPDTYEGAEFLAWDPAATKSPPGEGDPRRLTDAVRAQVSLGESGCPYEASLEAWYQFLVDPEPYQRIVLEDCVPGSGLRDCSRLDGLDEVLLEQRRRFLRPDSLVAILMLTDENDCSIAPGGRSHRYFDISGPSMDRATSACAQDPNDPCCSSCGFPDVPGCPPTASDPECARGPYPPEEDGPYLRCFDPKRRFGVDLLHPVQRYIDGLTGADVPRRDGTLVKNPLFHDAAGRPTRDPSLVFLGGIIGVPWQDIAVDHHDGERLVYKTARQMHEDGTWEIIVGDPDRGIPPLDPLMIESVEERTGVNPVTGDPLMPSTAPSPTANPINGHETELSAAGFEVQYACIFELPDPVPFSLECTGYPGRNRAICQNEDGSYGSTQYRAKAYPGLRQLQTLRGIGDNAIVASICARNLRDASRDDYGYRPALRALIDRLRVGLD